MPCGRGSRASRARSSTCAGEASATTFCSARWTRTAASMMRCCSATRKWAWPAALVPRPCRLSTGPTCRRALQAEPALQPHRRPRPWPARRHCRRHCAEFLHDTIKTREDVRKLGLACLGVVPRRKGKGTVVDDLKDASSPVSESYSAVLAALRSAPSMARPRSCSSPARMHRKASLPRPSPSPRTTRGGASRCLDRRRPAPAGVPRRIEPPGPDQAPDQ